MRLNGECVEVKLLASNVLSDGMIYGTIGLIYQGGNAVSIVANKYDFDPGADKGHPWNSVSGFLRNTLTELASGIATSFGISKGKGFLVRFSGEAHLKSFPIPTYDIDLNTAFGF